MFDRDLFGSVDRLLADVESASGHRINVLLDECQGWGVSRPAAPPDAPLSVIIVNQRAHDLRHAIASFYARQLLRRFTAKPLMLASANSDRRDLLQAELATRFSDIPASKIPGLTQILYDGLSQQIVSSLRGILTHREIALQQPDLVQQHRRFLSELLKANAQYLVQGGDNRYPAWFVRANRRLLAVEALGLAAIAGTTTTIRPALDQLGLTADAIPLAQAIAAGDLDELSDQQLGDLAISHSGAPADWLSWIPAATLDGPAAVAPQVTPQVRADQAQPDAGPASAYRISRDEADRLRREGQHQEAIAIYDQLMIEGGNADQVVLVGKAACLAGLGRSLDEVRGIAREAIGLDPTTDSAEEARQLITKLSVGKLHNDFDIRPDVVAYMREAISTYRRIKQAQGQALWAELGMLGASGLRDDGQARYKTKTLPSKTFTGLAAIIYIHVGTRLYASQVVDQLGHDFDREWAEATKDKP